MSVDLDAVPHPAVNYFDGDDLAADVFLRKYALPGELTPKDTHRRLAKEFARIEKKYPNPLSEKEIFNLFDYFNFIVPQGSPMAGIGNPNQIMSISNCFVIDSPYDSYSGILKTDQEQAQLMKRRGGVGFDISTLRPRGMTTANAAKSTDGIGVFMERFSNTTREVAQGGRRGALMLTIDVRHPDIMTFATIKRDTSKVTGANISIRLSDDFMKAVQQDEMFQLQWPVDSKEPKYTSLIKARELWDTIIESAHGSAEPGLLFWDTVKRRTPADCYPQFASVSTNPCVTGDTWVLTADGPRRVEQLLRSPFMAVVNGQKYSSSAFWETGTKNIIQLITNDGHHLRLTENHKVMTPDGWVEAGDLDIGDQIVLHDHTGFEWDGDGTNDEGYLLGHLVGDGTFHRDTPAVAVWTNDPGHKGPMDRLYKIVTTMSHRSDLKGWRQIADTPQYRLKTAAIRDLASRFGIYWTNKTITDSVESASSDFAKGFLRGLFDTDGHVEGDSLKGGVSIRLSQSNLELLRSTQRMLGRLGINTAIRSMKPAGTKEMPGGTYDVKQSFRLIISGSDAEKFINVIGFEDKVKLQKWNDSTSDMKRGFYKKQTTWIAEILNEGPKRVFDCSVDEVHAFDANGIYVHNCGEIVLSPYDSCRLLLVNVSSFIENPFSKSPSFDAEGYARTVYVAQRLMDDMVDLELECIDKILGKIENDPEPEEIKHVERDLWLKIRNACEQGRRTGLGLTGVGDAVAMLNQGYGSDQGIQTIEMFYRELALNSYRSSVKLAGERGAFPAYNYELEKDHEFINQIMDLDPQLKADWIMYGRRNIANTTTAPAGSMSMLTQTTSGIENAFSLSYTRRKKINPEDTSGRVDFIDDLGDKWQEFPVYHHNFKLWMDVTGKTDPAESPYAGSTAADIDWVQKVKVQAAAQKWVCHAISNTTNVPADTTIDTIKDIYMTGWESGCKGVTVYRDGSRSGVLINNTEEDKPDKLSINEVHAPKRPLELPCDIHNMTVLGEKWTFFVGLLDGKPYEIMGGLSENITLPRRVRNGKISKHNGPKYPVARYDLHYDYEKGEDDEMVIKDVTNIFNNTTYATFTRTLSLALRHGTPVQFVVEQLLKGTDEDLFSFSKAASRVLKHYIVDGTKRDKKCLDCGASDLIYQEGCMLCKSCGSSKCG